MNVKHLRHSITINHSTFLRLKARGFFGESFSDPITRILDELANRNSERDESS